MIDISDISKVKRTVLDKLMGRTAPRGLGPVTTKSYQSQSQINERTPMVALNKGGMQTPFFFLHGDWTDNGFFCFVLAQDLGKDRPFYMCDPYRFDGLGQLPTVEEMAAVHIAAIRSVQPIGPYQIGGFCNGGLLCYEMARQLRAEGERVSALVLIDSIPPRLRRVRQVIDGVGRWLHASDSRRLHWFLRMQHFYRFVFEHNAEDFEHLKRLNPRSHRLFPPLAALYLEYPALFTWATSMYEPGFYPEEVTLLWEAGEPERRTWWEQFANGSDQRVESVIIPGNHKTCRTDHIHQMAAQLKSRLLETSAAGRDHRYDCEANPC
jgi:thioesterase domain-containing protein